MTAENTYYKVIEEGIKDISAMNKKQLCDELDITLYLLNDWVKPLIVNGTLKNFHKKRVLQHFEVFAIMQLVKFGVEIEAKKVKISYENGKLSYQNLKINVE